MDDYRGSPAVFIGYWTLAKGGPSFSRRFGRRVRGPPVRLGRRRAGYRSPLTCFHGLPGSPCLVQGLQCCFTLCRVLLIRLVLADLATTAACLRRPGLAKGSHFLELPTDDDEPSLHVAGKFGSAGPALTI